MARKVSGSVTVAGCDWDYEGYLIPYEPGSMYNRWGDPGDPPEGGYVEDCTVLVDGVDIMDMTPEQWEELDCDETPESILEQVTDAAYEHETA